MSHFIEYKVRPITRYVVTRFEEYGEDSNKSGGSTIKGEFDNEEMAYTVAYALCKDEHSRLGWAPGDDRIRYPSQSKQSVAPLIAV